MSNSQPSAFVADAEISDVGERAYDAFIRRLERDVERGKESKVSVQRQWQRFEIAFTKAVDYLKRNSAWSTNSFYPRPS